MERDNFSLTDTLTDVGQSKFKGGRSVHAVSLSYQLEAMD